MDDDLTIFDRSQVYVMDNFTDWMCGSQKHKKRSKKVKVRRKKKGG